MMKRKRQETYKNIYITTKNSKRTLGKKDKHFTLQIPIKRSKK